MTLKIDYYLLSKSSPSASLLFCCRLTNKAYEAGLHIFVLTSSFEQSTELDALMWSFSDTLFLPHQIIEPSASPSSLCKIFIGSKYNASTQSDLLINLSNKTILEEKHFSRVADIVSSDETNKANARTRYAQRRNLSIKQNLHHIQL